MTVDTGPALSAILVAASDFRYLQGVLDSLKKQTIREQIEIVIVGPVTAAPNTPALDLEGFHGYQSTTVPHHDFSSAEGYAAGIRLAHAPVVVLCEDHSFPEPEWAERLMRAHMKPWAVVGPVVRNGNPETLLSWADFFLGYSEWAFPSRSGPRDHLPGHNSSYKRQLLLEYGPALEDMLEAETALHWDLRQHGHTLYLEAGAVTRHLNFARLGSWLPLHVLSGRRFAATRALAWPVHRRLLYLCASPLIPFVRFRRIVREASRPGRYAGSRLGLTVVLVVGLLLDGFGQMLGYAFGAGDARTQSARLEMHLDRRMATVPSWVMLPEREKDI